jgi:hypothetical protein
VFLRGLAPEGGWPISPREPVMNKQSICHQDQRKGRVPLKLHDLSAKKDRKGAISGTTSKNATSAIPTSLQEFLKRDSLPIKSA